MGIRQGRSVGDHVRSPALPVRRGGLASALAAEPAPVEPPTANDLRDTDRWLDTHDPAGHRPAFEPASGGPRAHGPVLLVSGRHPVALAARRPGAAGRLTP